MSNSSEHGLPSLDLCTCDDKGTISPHADRCPYMDAVIARNVEREGRFQPCRACATTDHGAERHTCGESPEYHAAVARGDYSSALQLQREPEQQGRLAPCCEPMPGGVCACLLRGHVDERARALAIIEEQMPNMTVDARRHMKLLVAALQDGLGDTHNSGEKRVPSTHKSGEPPRTEAQQ